MKIEPQILRHPLDHALFGTAEIERLADASQDIAKAGNRLADMMDIARAVERLTQHKD